MALSCNNQLDLYSGGPSRQKQRGFVTVSEPALGFFITGTNIGPACGIYVAVRTDAIKKIDPAHKVLLAYRNDSAPHWGMALVEPRDAQKKREIKKSKRQRQRSQWGHFGYEDDEDSDEEGKKLFPPTVLRVMAWKEPPRQDDDDSRISVVLRSLHLCFQVFTVVVEDECRSMNIQQTLFLLPECSQKSSQR